MLVVADDLPTARTAARTRWKGCSRAHVDAVMQIDIVDGYRVTLQETSDPDSNEIDET